MTKEQSEKVLGVVWSQVVVMLYTIWYNTLLIRPSILWSPVKVYGRANARLFQKENFWKHLWKTQSLDDSEDSRRLHKVLDPLVQDWCLRMALLFQEKGASSIYDQIRLAKEELAKFRTEMEKLFGNDAEGSPEQPR